VHKGTVKWFNASKSYGFLAPDDGTPGVFVRFDPEQGNRRVQAKSVRPA